MLLIHNKHLLSDATYAWKRQPTDSFLKKIDTFCTLS